MEATEDSVGYTRHLCVVCNYSYLSDFVTSGDTGYIEEEVQEPQHKHLYQLHVQDNAEDKYFIALRVCVCGDSKVGNLTANLTDENGQTILLFSNEYGQFDYAGIYGNYIVTITDEDGAELTMFDISAGEAPVIPDETPDGGNEEIPGETPDGGNEEIPDKTPDYGNEEQPDETPDSGNEELPDETPDGGNEEQPGDTTEPAEDEGKGSAGTAIILLIIFLLLVAGGIGAVIFMKQRQ